MDIESKGLACDKLNLSSVSVLMSTGDQFLPIFSKVLVTKRSVGMVDSGTCTCFKVMKISVLGSSFGDIKVSLTR